MSKSFNLRAQKEDAMNLQAIVFSEVKEELLVILWERLQRRTEENNSV